MALCSAAGKEDPTLPRCEIDALRREKLRDVGIESDADFSPSPTSATHPFLHAHIDAPFGS